eukprot:GHVP01050341.1.p1 GENE.GHVP01050341.1~~GHVP01050341.1.p1  ORF type:complete len:113 (+),score=33.53 GHVP01050341.1:980-1318(+)
MKRLRDVIFEIPEEKTDCEEYDNLFGFPIYEEDSNEEDLACNKTEDYTFQVGKHNEVVKDEETCQGDEITNGTDKTQNEDVKRGPEGYNPNEEAANPPKRIKKESFLDGKWK